MSLKALMILILMPRIIHHWSRTITAWTLPCTEGSSSVDSVGYPTLRGWSDDHSLCHGWWNNISVSHPAKTSNDTSTSWTNLNITFTLYICGHSGSEVQVRPCMALGRLLSKKTQRTVRRMRYFHGIPTSNGLEQERTSSSQPDVKEHIPSWPSTVYLIWTFSKVLPAVYTTVAPKGKRRTLSSE